MNLTAAVITDLVNMVCAKGTVYQADLKAFDLVALISNTRQLLNCGLSLKYTDTRRGYSLSTSAK